MSILFDHWKNEDFEDIKIEITKCKNCGSETKLLCNDCRQYLCEKCRIPVERKIFYIHNKKTTNVIEYICKECKNDF